MTVMLDAFVIRKIAWLFLLFQSGCALHYTDRLGQDRHIGFVSIKIAKNGCLLTNTVNSIGLSLDLTQDSGGANVGMRTISKAYIVGDTNAEFEEDKQGSIVVTKYNTLKPEKKNSCAINSSN